MSAFQKTNDFNDIVYGRRSVKLYDPEVKISREEMEEMLEKASKAPSSINMQPWRFVVIDSEAGKETLLPLARFNKDQVQTSAAVIAVFADRSNFDYADEIYSASVAHGYMPQEVKEMQLAAFAKLYGLMTDEQLKDVMLLDAGLVSMQLMLVARSHGYETNPIGGYEKDKIAEAFGLDAQRYVPVMLISVGKAASAGYPSYRLPVARTTVWK